MKGVGSWQFHHLNQMIVVVELPVCLIENFHDEHIVLVRYQAFKLPYTLFDEYGAILKLFDPWLTFYFLLQISGLRHETLSERIKCSLSREELVTALIK